MGLLLPLPILPLASITHLLILAPLSEIGRSVSAIHGEVISDVRGECGLILEPIRSPIGPTHRRIAIFLRLRAHRYTLKNVALLQLLLS